MKSSHLNFFILIIFFCIKIINSSIERKRHYGKCIYILSDTGSKIINFYKYTNKEYFPKNNNFSFNLCNDTKYNKLEGKKTKVAFDSQLVYNDKNRSIKLTGPFFFLKNDSWKNFNVLDKEKDDVYKYRAQFGDFCDDNNTTNYSVSIIFEHKDIEDKNIEVSAYPDISNCSSTFRLNYNKEYATDYLLLQKVLNDCYIFTGIIFILLGIYLCFLSFRFQTITKIIISIVFGQLIMFNIALICIGNSTALKDNFFILIICLGFVIGAPFIYFTRKIEKLYHLILSISSGYVCGIFIYQVFFFNTNSVLTLAILIDVLVIFTTSFIGLNLIVPRNIIYYPPFIGSYILLRGFSLFIYNTTGKGGFGDLQLLIYLIRVREKDLVNEYFENEYKYFYVYLIFIGLILIGSEVIIFFLNKTKYEISYSDLDDDENTDITLKKVSNLEDY